MLACDDFISQLQLTIHAYEWSWFHRLDRMYYKLDHQSHLVTWCCSGLVSPYPVRYGWPKRLRPLQRHYLSFYIKYYTCLSGSFGVTCLKQLTMHLAIHLDAEPYDCTICGKSFSWADCIKTHIPRPWMMVHTTALFVERPSTGRATSKLIFPAHGWWSVQLQYLWKVLQLGGLHQNSYSPLGARRKAWLENTHFALWNFSRTGWGYTASSDIYIYISW